MKVIYSVYTLVECEFKVEDSYLEDKIETGTVFRCLSKFDTMEEAEEFLESGEIKFYGDPEFCTIIKEYKRL